MSRLSPLVLLACLTRAVAANGDVLFQDNFATVGTRLDVSVWTTEFGPPSFLGRTQLADWVTPGGRGRFVVDPTGAQLALDTFNPTGFSLYGTHAKTIRSFQPAAGSTIEFTTRLHLTSLQPGLVFGMYLYRCNGNCSTHDEIDIELVTNLLQPGQPLRVQLNRYADEPLGAANGSLAALPAGFDPLAPHDWTIRWSLSRIDYFVDGVLLSSATTHVPQGPMQVNEIVWGPAQDWPAAFSAALQPAGSGGQNQAFAARLRSVTVRETSGAIPGAPVAVAAVTTGSSLNLSWASPGPGAPLTAHNLTFFAGEAAAIGPATLVAHAAIGPAPAATLAIPPGAQGTFSVRVTAVAGSESSLPSAPATFTIGGAGCTAPPPTPTGVSGTRGDRMAVVRWNSSPGATSYVVEVGTSPGAANVFAGRVGAVTSVSGTVDAALPLFVRVLGENACGRSAATPDLPLLPAASR